MSKSQKFFPFSSVSKPARTRSACMVPTLMQSALTLWPVMNVVQDHSPLAVSEDARRIPMPLMLTAHMLDVVLTGVPVSGFSATLLKICPSSKDSTLYVPTALNCLLRADCKSCNQPTEGFATASKFAREAAPDFRAPATVSHMSVSASTRLPNVTVVSEVTKSRSICETRPLRRIPLSANCLSIIATQSPSATPSHVRP